MLVANTSLTSLTLSNANFRPSAVRHLFDSLKQNRHLTFLSLAHCTVAREVSVFPGLPIETGWPTASILDCLQANTTLRELDFTGTTLEHDNSIRAVLLRNKEKAEREKVLKSSRSRLVRPTAVRLFFCGLPYSGKTTLARSLVNWNKNASWLSRTTSTSRLKRTRGIEVTMLEKKEGGQHQRILLWDMAGHLEFYSFHDSMFPDLSGRATPSMFLFVWNPFNLDGKGNIQSDSQGHKIRKDPRKFEAEFKYWLRFIASKTMQSEIFKPKVLVAITRADLGFEDIDKAGLMWHFNVLQEEFQELIQFDEKGLFYLNAKDHVQAGQLGSYVFDCSESILKLLPDVFQACTEARELLGNMVRDNQIPPLITKVKFHQICEEELHMDSERMREAIALSLNDSGDLIYFKSLELVVLDTQWFCHKIMGNLLNDIVTNEAMKARGVFFPAPAVEALLEGIVNSRAARTFKWNKKRVYKSMKVSGCDLVNLLVGLRLACHEDVAQTNSRIFLSVSLSGKAKRTMFPSNCLVNEGKSVTTYLGRRLTCENSNCTFLTPGIFPLLQVTFHNILHDRAAPVHVRLEEDVIAFAFDGVKVFIEFCRLEGEDHFIDILLYSPKHLDETMEWLQENVIHHVERVRAEPRGIQGVKLAHAIIQPACIENFLDAHERPATSVKELHTTLRNHVERKGVNGIKSVLHTWQARRTNPSDAVVDLLGETETAKVIQTYYHSLSDAESEISNLYVQEVVGTSQPQKPEFGMSQSSKERRLLYNKLCELETNVMRNLEKLEHAVHGLRNSVLPKLSELFTFVKEGEAGKLPRIFVVTKDGQIVRRLVSAMVPGLHNVRLQLLCECRSESCHVVDGKQGLSLATLDDGLLKRGLPYISALLKVAYVVTRVGAHVAVGWGDSIPDFTRVLASVVDADEVPHSASFADDWISPSRVNFQDGQQWLFDVLSNSDCIKGDRIHAMFGLRRVRFGDSRAAWVCDIHYHEGTPWPA